MKKGLSKLILSGAAVAAVAATLGTSTYAWYTTNPTVNANNIVGASSDTGASSIFISKDSGSPKSWSQTVTFAASDFAAKKLIPAQPTSTAGAFTNLAGTASGDNDVLKFTLYFKTSKTAANVPLYIKSISVENTTTTQPSADNLAYTGESGTVGGIDTTKATYKIDIVKALAIQVSNTSESVKTNFSLSGYQKEGNAKTTDGNDAHGYYNAVMPADKALASEDITTGQGLTSADIAADLAIAQLDKDGAAETIDFYIYLNGWSNYCYDACQGQDFKINMSFTSDVTAALNHA